MAYNNFSLNSSLPPTLPIHVHIEFMLKNSISQSSYIVARETESDLMPNTGNIQSTNSCLQGGLEWIHWSISSFHLVNLQIEMKILWAVFLNCFIFFVWHDLKLSFIL